jgi:D-alanyl-D-alanine carboxypeptidase
MLAKYLLVAALLLPTRAAAGELSEEAGKRLLAAYPEQLERIESGILVWRDGTRMPLDDGKGEKPFAEWLDHPDIEDMLAVPYPEGDLALPPAKDVDPGRARNTAFFDKVYGDCRKGEVEKNLSTVIWLPKKTGQRLPFSKVNGAAQHLEAVSRELDELPAKFDVYLFPSAGTYNCRPIAGTNRISAHGQGIAIDIALKHSDYWRNTSPGKDGGYAYRNEIPMEIVRVFERHGFIWGGKWHHYDTMHFEYRPELLGTGG